MSPDARGDRRSAAFDVVARELARPLDDFTGTMPVAQWLDASVCPFHGVCCSTPAQRRREYRRAAEAFEETSSDVELRAGAPPSVASGSFSGRHIFLFKLEAKGTTYRVGEGRDLRRWDDYAE